MSAVANLQAVVHYDPWLLLLSATGVVLAMVGTLTAASLLLYSPSRLLMRSKDAGNTALADELTARGPDYQVVGRAYAIGGLVLALLALHSGVDAQTLPVALGVLGVVVLFCCGVLPAALAERRAESALVRLVPALRPGWWLLRYPIAIPMRMASKLVLRALRIREEQAPAVGELAEEVVAAVSDTVAEEPLDEDERNWIGNIVRLRETTAADIMTPRTDLIGIPADLPTPEALALAVQHGFSRYPVYRDTMDHVIGLFYVKDALRLLLQDPARPRPPLQELLREPFFVPNTMDVAHLLLQFKARKQQLAVVIDEYGGTTGLVTIEDIVEEIVGDIEDEYDEPAAGGSAGQNRIDVVEDGRVIEIPARLRVDELNRLLPTSIAEHDDYDTVAGYVISQLNRIPRTGEVCQIHGIEFRVLDGDDRRLARLRVTALQPQAAGENG